MESMTNYVRRLQTTYPKWPDMDVIAKVREVMESGAFGRELCALLQPPPASTGPSVGQSVNFFVPVSQPAGNGYPMYSQPASYPQQGMPHVFYDTTINPATLDSTFTYMGHLNGEDADSDGTQPEHEFETPYNYVSVLGLIPDLIVQDTHDASFGSPHPLTCGFSREVFSASFGKY